MKIWNLLKNVYFNLINWLYIINFKIRKDDCIIYKNITDNLGLPVSGKQLVGAMKEFNGIILKDSEGRRFLITHGNPDGSMKISRLNLMLSPDIIGEFILISCYNGRREDIITPTYSLIREQNTISNDCIAFCIIDNNLWLSINPNLVLISKIMSILS